MLVLNVWEGEAGGGEKRHYWSFPGRHNGYCHYLPKFCIFLKATAIFLSLREVRPTWCIEKKKRGRAKLDIQKLLQIHSSHLTAS